MIAASQTHMHTQSHAFIQVRAYHANTGKQTCGASLLSMSQVADTLVPPASQPACWLNGNALFAFLLGSLQGSNNRALSITLQLLWNSLCKTNAHLQPLCFVQCLWFPLQCSPSCPQVRHLNDHLEGAGRISLSFYSLIALWEVHNCLFSINSL